MQRQSKINTLRKQDSWSFQKAFTNYTVLLLAFIFFLQQLFAFGLFTLPQTTNGAVPVVKQQHQSSAVAAYVRAQLPSQSTPIGLEMEVETAEEDDTKNNLEEYCNNLASIHAVEEQVYTSFLRSRYLQLASSVHNQPTVPFFILYHSWKNYLA